MSEAEPSFHERQSWHLCALHTSNNLLQKRRFRKQDFDAYADELATLSTTGFYIFHPHRSTLKVGDYDFNVLAFAFEKENLELEWLDGRKELNSVDWDAPFGIIVNILQSSWLSLGLFSDRHWFAVRKFHGAFWNLDSRLERPTKIGDAAKLVEFIQTLKKECSNVDIIFAKEKSVTQ